MRRTPGMAAVAVITLALGIGANTAIFSVVHGVLLVPLPLHDPDGLMVIWERNIPRQRHTNVVSPGNYLHWRDLNQSFADIGAVSLTLRTTLTGAGDPVEIPTQLATANIFAVAGVAPRLGRTFDVDEDRPESHVVIISDRLWRQRFSADPSVVGRTVTLDSEETRIVGVMPPQFSLLDADVGIWQPLGLTEASRTPRGRWLIAFGRLRSGVDRQHAQADMDRVSAEMTRRFPAFNTGWAINVVPVTEQVTGGVRSALLLLLAAVAGVLLIACANVANLLLARATGRQRELALRAALGAPRGRLVRQLLGESLALASAGGLAGLALAWIAIRVLRVVVADRVPIPRLDSIALDPVTLAFTGAIALLSGLVFGTAPALAAARADLQDRLKEGGRTGTGARGQRTRGLLVVAELALALLLLVGAGLLLRSFARLMATNPGFDTARTVTMHVSLPSNDYPTDVARVNLFRDLFARVESLPGVRAAGGVSFLPLTGLGAATSFAIEGRPAPPIGQEPTADVRAVAHDYFEAMGIRLVRGRLFTDRETPETAHVVIINETLAREFWPGGDPIGQRLAVSWTGTGSDEIIGVVTDVRHAGLDVSPRPMIYWPHQRSAYSSMAIAVRTDLDPVSVVSAVVGEIRQIDARLPVADIRTLDEVVSRSVSTRRATMLMLGLLAGVAVTLAAVGIFGVLACMVAQRTQELGVRMALGADRATLLRLVVGHALRLSIAGVALGAALALALVRFMRGLLYGIEPSDPVTFVAVAAMLTIVALGAALVPALRATRVDPLVALRAE